jgi:HK97 family phage prohead protease
VVKIFQIFKIEETMTETKHMDFQFDIKALAEDGTFTGYASVFGVVDSQKDLIQHGAFSRTLRQRKGDVKLLWQHKIDEPIGVFLSLREDAHGLFVEGKLLLDVQRAEEAYALLKSGAINGMSIGYSVVKADYNNETGVRLILDVDLFEISLVTFPANENATITSVKSGVPQTTREFEKFLRENGFSRSQAKSFTRHGFKGEEVAEFNGLEESMERALASLVALV